MTDTYAEEFYRGISTPNDITPEGYLMAGAFKFDQYNPALRDDDGFCELSINWNDSDDALTTLLNQHKPGIEEVQFRGGYCKISRILLHLALKQYMDDQCFSYERRPVEAAEENDYQANPFHGNLLMKDSLDKNVKKNIQHSLAAIAGSVFTR